MKSKGPSLSLSELFFSLKVYLSLLCLCSLSLLRISLSLSLLSLTFDITDDHRTGKAFFAERMRDIIRQRRAAEYRDRQRRLQIEENMRERRKVHAVVWSLHVWCRLPSIAFLFSLSLYCALRVYMSYCRFHFAFLLCRYCILQ